MASSNTRTHSSGRVAFSWENKPGVCKAAVTPPRRRFEDEDLLQKKLRPPPCTSATKGNRKLQKDGGVEDPFLAAYRECTTGDDEKNYKLQKNKSAFGPGLEGWMNLIGKLSCKHLTAVRDDSLISSPVSKRTEQRTTRIQGVGKRREYLPSF